MSSFDSQEKLNEAVDQADRSIRDAAKRIEKAMREGVQTIRAQSDPSRGSTTEQFDEARALNKMDPAAKAVAEVRAREAGLSLGQWLEGLVYEYAAPTRPHVYYGGGPAVWTENAGAVRSGALTTVVKSAMNYDIDAGTYVPFVRFSEFKTSNLDRFAHYAADDSTLSAMQVVAAFPPRISRAAILLSAAFAAADVRDFRVPRHRPGRRYKAASRWYHALVDFCLHRSREVRAALVHHWTPSGRAERLWCDAYVTLCDLTPARHELLILFTQDRGKASIELAKYLDLATQQFELSANLLADVETPASAEPTDEQRFADLRATLLERAGGGVSLTEGAALLGVTRQALHKRIQSGSALGMMNGEAIVLPRLQWTTAGGKTEFVAGLSEVVKLFERAGGWSALQFLLDPDPNLGQAPIETLRAGRVAAAVAAARAYLGLDEG